MECLMKAIRLTGKELALQTRFNQSQSLMSTIEPVVLFGVRYLLRQARKELTRGPPSTKTESRGLLAYGKVPNILMKGQLIAVAESLTLDSKVVVEDLTEDVEVLVPEERDGKEIVVKKLKHRRTKKRCSFAAVIAADAKNHFGGTPQPTKANSLSVMKYLVSKCQERKLTSLQTRQVSCMAMALVFQPDSNDKFIYSFMNDREIWEKRKDVEDAMKIPSIFMAILKRPFGKKEWLRVWDKFCGLGTQKAFAFCK